MTNWCWAAVALGIAVAYGDRSVMRQCEIASRVLSRNSCPDATVDESDSPHTLEDALGPHFKALNGNRSFEFVKQQIDDGRPVALHISWRDGGAGHFLVISGYYEDGAIQAVYVCDPATGLRSKLGFEHVRDHYQQHGSWDRTYETIGDRRVPEIHDDDPFTPAPLTVSRHHSRALRILRAQSPNSRVR